MFLCLLFERMMVILTPQTTNVLKWTIFQSLSYLPQKKNPLQPCLSPEMRKKHEFLVSLLNLYWTRRRVFRCLHFKVQRQDVWITWDRDIFGEQLAVGSCVKSQHMCVTGCYHKNMMHILRWNAFFLCFSFFFFKIKYLWYTCIFDVPSLFSRSSGWFTFNFGFHCADCYLYFRVAWDIHHPRLFGNYLFNWFFSSLPHKWSFEHVEVKRQMYNL